jgi:hypothetical protein
MDATWYPQSDSTNYHLRVIKLDTAGPADEPFEIYDHRLEVLHGGGDPVLLAKGQLTTALHKWAMAIGSFEPF